MNEVSEQSVIGDFRGTFSFLSNFFVDSDGFCIENVYQAAKAVDAAEREWALSSPNPRTAKRRGRRVKIRPGWDQLRVRAMRSMLLKKFSRPSMREALLATGSAVLIEGNSWGDKFWGQSPLGEGENVLGKLLMELRSSLMVERNRKNAMGGSSG